MRTAPTHSTLRWAPLPVLVLSVVFTACRSGPLFQPDRFHLELIRHHAAETGLYAERYPADMVCLRPTRPLCACRPNELRRAVGGLAWEQRLDLNLASIEDFESLPGIGPALAERIMTYRKSRAFTDTEQLLEVQGIGPGRFARIRNLVRVDWPEGRPP